ncbi:hypothetical protein WJX72_006715 [[Myrmecia] bisecta]|uniref:DUF2232 domain-containing protein n=1 Tax=[Myrmecia] bisecta TaxID=41462 RepID=A0AAW1QRB3_9CHLO
MHDPKEDPQLLRATQEHIRQQQEQGTAPVYGLDDTRRLVETAMLAAVSGLAYTLATLMKLEGYLGYFLPMPVIVSAMRSGPSAGRKTMVATCFLLLVLLGPVQAVSYLLTHGLTASVIGTLWCWHAPWVLSVPVGAAVRVLGTLGYLKVSGWTLNENLFALLLNNVYSLLDQLASSVGAAGAPPTTVVIVVIGSLLLVNAVCYIFLMHVIYTFLLRNMGYSMVSMPAFVTKFLYRNVPQRNPQA